VSPNSGIYLVHKPVGRTSFSLVQAFMEEVRLAGIRRDKLPVCHGGALDPFASGLLLLLAGQATRLMELLHDVPKTYIAQISWGAETDNGDLLGAVTATASSLALTPALLDDALRAFVGWHDQIPPAHSNKRVGGERAHVRARRGESFSLPPSRVYLHEARFLEHDLPKRSTLRLVTGGGYYVRSLARDLGRATSALAHLSALRRTAIGPWDDPGPDGARVHIHGEALFPWLPSLQIAAHELASLRDGKDLPLRAPDPAAWPLPAGFPDPRSPVRALLGGDLVALLRERAGRWTAAPALKSPL
jgi:tRNA pseudouridine55 synthase